jgi:hypothetical protein
VGTGYHFQDPIGPWDSRFSSLDEASGCIRLHQASGANHDDPEHTRNRRLVGPAPSEVLNHSVCDSPLSATPFWPVATGFDLSIAYVPYSRVHS